MSTSTTPSPPRGLMRLFFRMPIWLYRLGLGGVLSSRFLLLEHIGRKSGLLRRAVVEVVRHDPETGAYFIASGYGEHSQWFQNLMHTPEITIQVGRRRIDVRAERLSLEQATEELVRYGSANPSAARMLGKLMGLEWDGSPESSAEITRHIPLIALRPR